VSITNIEQYEAATQRVSQFADMPEGSTEAKKLAELVAAVLEWDKRHFDDRADLSVKR